MRRVILESPYGSPSAWQRFKNRRYARACMHDCLRRGEAPFASHLLYTQVLNDQDPHEREWGIASGFAWLEIADASVVYYDRGISKGMRAGIDAAQREGVPVEYRSLYNAVDHEVSAPKSGSHSRSTLDITLLFQHGKALPAGLMYRRVAGDVLPSGDRDIDIGWIDFDGEALSP
jgi:hypothetical protein